MGCSISTTVAATSERPKSPAVPAASPSSHLAVEVALVDVTLAVDAPVHTSSLPPGPPPVTRSPVSSARALFDFKATSEEELSLEAGQLVEVIRDELRFCGVAHSFRLALQITEKSDSGWWRGKCGGKEVCKF